YILIIRCGIPHRAVGILFFFFQAEDGIRDRTVTGVQTCALPICCLFCHGELYRTRPAPAHLTAFYLTVSAGGALGGLLVAVVARSEERRVGKECRWRWLRDVLRERTGRTD